MAHGIVAKGDVVPCPVDAAGCFTPEVSDFAGVHVKEADKGIIAAIKATGRLYDSASLVHSYPFCWRSDTPLIYKVPSLSMNLPCFTVNESSMFQVQRMFHFH